MVSRKWNLCFLAVSDSWLRLMLLQAQSCRCRRLLNGGENSGVTYFLYVHIASCRDLHTLILSAIFLHFIRDLVSLFRRPSILYLVFCSTSVSSMGVHSFPSFSADHYMWSLPLRRSFQHFLFLMWFGFPDSVYIFGFSWFALFFRHFHSFSLDTQPNPPLSLSPRPFWRRTVKCRRSFSEVSGYDD